MTYKQLLTKTATAPGVIVGTGLGMAAGGTSGYYLSKYIHKNPTIAQKFLYSLGGAAAGGLGTHLVFSDYFDELNKDDAIRKDPEKMEAIREAEKAEYAAKESEDLSNPNAATIAGQVASVAGGTYLGRTAGGLAAELKNSKKTADAVKFIKNHKGTWTQKDIAQYTKKFTKGTGTPVPIQHATGIPNGTDPRVGKVILSDAKKAKTRGGWAGFISTALLNAIFHESITRLENEKLKETFGRN